MPLPSSSSEPFPPLALQGWSRCQVQVGESARDKENQRPTHDHQEVSWAVHAWLNFLCSHTVLFIGYSQFTLSLGALLVYLVAFCSNYVYVYYSRALKQYSYNASQLLQWNIPEHWAVDWIEDIQAVSQCHSPSSKCQAMKGHYGLHVRICAHYKTEALMRSHVQHRYCIIKSIIEECQLRAVVFA